ncbi:phage portal protein [Ferribacterium limneticum]|uniref:phage portal protein n=1 Tax=Ferribacterium limneticum TaxID=76259 RepID=UPI001CFAFE32|nr:phage portal protein [Ferribacterium limneticum]UCV27003.1 phage portal protein [Ferribacterium limneticum]UCV30920.1 phage portal protein [Ferribacterium limneticum]
MKILGFDLSFKKALQPVSSGSNGWFPLVRESSPGAWQNSTPIEVDTALAHSAVFACVSLISNDIAKLPLRITKDMGTYWAPTAHEYSALLRKPNQYQNRAQFISQWITSKLLHGNTYALKRRNARGIVIALHVLDPLSVTPLVSEDGAVFYRLKTSHLATIGDVVVPAREIIHDRAMTPFHPLVGVSPLVAAGLAATQALNIQNSSSKFFQNGSRPGGILTAPGIISDDTANRLKTHWEANYTGDNAGKTAVLGDGLKYESMATTATDAQLIEQLAFSAQDVCRAFHVPAWKIGAGPAAPYTSSEATNLQYLTDCLQSHIEALELSLDDGLELPPTLRTELDESSLLRLDTATRTTVLAASIKAGLITINEGRASEGRAPVAGGDEIFRQIQDVPLAAPKEQAQ